MVVDPNPGAAGQPTAGHPLLPLASLVAQQPLGTAHVQGVDCKQAQHASWQLVITGVFVATMLATSQLIPC
jgi:hypothetical protein